jgi:hypothetical protein
MNYGVYKGRFNSIVLKYLILNPKCDYCSPMAQEFGEVEFVCNRATLNKNP